MHLPQPPELFARFEHGEIERDELQRLMALRAQKTTMTRDRFWTLRLASGPHPDSAG